MYVPSSIRCLSFPPLLLNAAIIFSLFFFSRGQGVFLDIEFFRGIFVEKPSVNFHQLNMQFHVQCIFLVTSFIVYNAGPFFKITATTMFFQNKIL